MGEELPERFYDVNEIPFELVDKVETQEEQDKSDSRE